MPITPHMIQTTGGTDNHWFNAFDKCEREVSAKLFVRACQKADSWTVAKHQLNAEDSGKSFLFNGLIHMGWIADNHDGTYTATHRFICHVLGMFPAAGFRT